jgi:hypothetical protein
MFKKGKALAKATRITTERVAREIRTGVFVVERSNSVFVRNIAIGDKKNR